MDTNKAHRCRNQSAYSICKEFDVYFICSHPVLLDQKVRRRLWRQGMEAAPDPLYTQLREFIAGTDARLRFLIVVQTGRCALHETLARILCEREPMPSPLGVESHAYYRSSTERLNAHIRSLRGDEAPTVLHVECKWGQPVQVPYEPGTLVLYNRTVCRDLGDAQALAERARSRAGTKLIFVLETSSMPAAPGDEWRVIQTQSTEEAKESGGGGGGAKSRSVERLQRLRALEACGGSLKGNSTERIATPSSSSSSSGITENPLFVTTATESSLPDDSK